MKPWEKFGAAQAEAPAAPKPWEKKYEGATAGTGAKEQFLDYMGEVEGKVEHQGAEGGSDALTYGYGLKETKRKELKIPLTSDHRDMAGQAYQNFYDKAQKGIPNLEQLDDSAQVFATSAAWNTGTVWGSVKKLAKSDEFNSKDVSSWVSNMRTGGKNLAGLSNRRIKDYNVLAGGRDWPKVKSADYTDKEVILTFENGDVEIIRKNKIEPTRTPSVNFD